MRRTRGVLSDGREIVWYDADSTPGRVAGVDRRGLSRDRPPTQLRYDPLLAEWVAIATHRQNRTHLPEPDRCPLCPTVGERLTEVPSADYDVVVFENRFPSYAAGAPVDMPAVDAPFGVRPGAGRCEVVCFTSAHRRSFGQLTTERVRHVVDVLAERTACLAAGPDVAHVFPFENRGEAIGVTLRHPHGQIYGYPFVPPRTARMADAARAHQERTGGDLFSDVLAAERAGPRLVVDGEHWSAFVPAAARWPVEVHLVPRRHVPDLPGLTAVERDELALLWPDLLRRLDVLHGVPLPYVAAWQQAPAAGAARELLRLHLQVFSVQRTPTKLKYLAGSESGAGAFVCDVLPEQGAARLRAAGVSSSP